MYQYQNINPFCRVQISCYDVETIETLTKTRLWAYIQAAKTMFSLKGNVVLKTLDSRHGSAYLLQ